MEITTEQHTENAPSLFDVAKIKHIVTDGVYIKTYFVPKGVKIYSKQFPTDHATILAYGSVLLDDGTTKTRFVAPAHYIFPANRRIPIVTLEDCVWYCIHPTDVTDVETLKELY